MHHLVNSGLLEKHHAVHYGIGTGLNAVEVDTTGNRRPGLVVSVPEHTVTSGLLVSHCITADNLSGNIVDLNPYISLDIQRIVDIGLRIEGIGIVVGYDVVVGGWCFG